MNQIFVNKKDVLPKSYFNGLYPLFVTVQLSSPNYSKNSWDFTKSDSSPRVTPCRYLRNWKSTGKNISAAPLSTKYVSKSCFSALLYPLNETIGALIPPMLLIRLSKSLIIKWASGTLTLNVFSRLNIWVGRNNYWVFVFLV